MPAPSHRSARPRKQPEGSVANCVRGYRHTGPHEGGSEGQGARDAELLARLSALESTSPNNFRNGGGYKNPEIDSLFKVLRESTDDALRVTTMKRVNQILMYEDVDRINLVDIPDFYVWNAKLRGVQTGYSYPMKVNNAWWADTALPGAMKIS